MAAGHPRLAFELDTFTERWRTAGRQPHYRVDDDYRARKADFSHAYTWATGVLDDARQRLGLVRDPAFAASGLFPELGLYDCHACHRTMKTVQWRALPRHGGSGPGVPFLNDSSFVMALSIAAGTAADLRAPLEAALSRLHVAASGGIEELRAAAAELDRQLAAVQARISDDGLRRGSRAVLDALLASAAAGNFLDYVSAEQAFMAVQMFAIELGDRRLEAALDDLARSLEDDERYRPAQFARLLNQGR